MSKTEDIANGLRELRHAFVDLTQTEVARRLGFTQPAIARIESIGDRISVRTMKMVLEALGCEFEILVTTPSGKRVALVMPHRPLRQRSVHVDDE